MWILMAVALYLSGYTEGNSVYFNSKAECEDGREKIEQFIRDWNTSNDDKVIKYAAECVPMKAAPKGKAV